jgi:hypothetical protein
MIRALLILLSTLQTESPVENGKTFFETPGDLVMMLSSKAVSYDINLENETAQAIGSYRKELIAASPCRNRSSKKCKGGTQRDRHIIWVLR